MEILIFRAIVLFGLLIACLYFRKKYLDTLTALNSAMETHNSQLAEARKQAIQQSKSVMLGKTTEELIPLFTGFKYNLEDCRFHGAPIDYIVYDNLLSYRTNNPKEITIVFADVKFNTGATTKAQRAIKDAIINGRVRFETWHVNKDNKITIK